MCALWILGDLCKGILDFLENLVFLLHGGDDHQCLGEVVPVVMFHEFDELWFDFIDDCLDFRCFTEIAGFFYECLHCHRPVFVFHHTSDNLSFN